MGKYRRLTRADRYQIERFLAVGKKVRWIADFLGFHRSSIYKEIKLGRIIQQIKGGKRRGEYSARESHRRFLARFEESRRGCFYQGHKIKGWVEDQIRIKLSERWSPEQISERLFIDQSFSVSTEAIYKFILSCKKRGERLHKYLRKDRRRRKRFKRRSRYWELQQQRRKSIESRPDEANNRAKEGHWERDLMLGKRNSGAILTMVDRKTQYVLLEKLKTTYAKETNQKTERRLKKSKLPCLTLTNDNGHEFGEFWNLESALKIPIYFAHPLCPWERGSVENTIGLLRQFIPKGTNLKQITKRDITWLEHNLNSRPRKSLNYKTPLEALTGKQQRLIKQKRIALQSPEYYEHLYLTAEEIEERRKLREKTVALTG